MFTVRRPSNDENFHIWRAGEQRVGIAGSQGCRWKVFSAMRWMRETLVHQFSVVTAFKSPPIDTDNTSIPPSYP
jgi:hypothetical protein